MKSNKTLLIIQKLDCFILVLLFNSYLSEIRKPVVLNSILTAKSIIMNPWKCAYIKVVLLSSKKIFCKQRFEIEVFGGSKHVGGEDFPLRVFGFIFFAEKLNLVITNKNISVCKICSISVENASCIVQIPTWKLHWTVNYNRCRVVFSFL